MARAKARLQMTVARWLAAESGADRRRAELALRQVFLRLPVPTPAPDFVDRVLWRLGLLPQPAPAAASFGFRWKAVLAVCWTLAALATTLMPQALGALWVGLRPGKLVDYSAGLVVMVSERLASGLAVWETLSGVVAVVVSRLSAPTLLAASLVAALISIAAFGVLHGLLSPQRSSHYA